MTNPTDGPIHTWFGLSYCNYQVLHRTLMQSMPIEWQQRMVACLEQLSSAFAHIEQPEGFKVDAAVFREPWELSPNERQRAGLTVEYEDATDETFTYLLDGQEIDRHASVPLPVSDPVPHYQRGRTYIEPRLCDRCMGSGIDPEHAASEDYGDVVREVPVPCTSCQLAGERP